MPITDIDFAFDLNHLSVVMDVGGFEGCFTDLIRKKYNCGVHVFEPSTKFFAHIVERFKNDALVWPYSCALGDCDKESELFLCDNGSSLFIPKDTSETVRVRDIDFFMRAFKLPQVDLIKLNCEGGEYAILNRLIETGWIPKIKNIVVQFHSIPGFDRKTFEAELAKTHETGHYNENWQWWKLK